MKKNKILAGLSALVMGATMMVGTAMSASAATVYDTDGTTVLVAATYADPNNFYPGTGGGFWAYYQNNYFTTLGWHPAPYGMYDGNIAKIQKVSGETYEITLKSFTYDGNEANISGIYAATDTDMENNMISNGKVSLVNGSTYLYTVDGIHASTLKFVITT